MLSTATADYAYTIANSTPDFVLLPEILVRLGEAYALLPELAKAIQSYERAIEIKPDYWPAYERLATAYTQARLPDRALEALRNGLRVLPEQPELLRQYKQLGGKLADVARPPSALSADKEVSDSARLNQPNAPRPAGSAASASCPSAGGACD
jgi:tetratricopeptide (TPR) repeat protein